MKELLSRRSAAALVVMALTSFNLSAIAADEGEQIDRTIVELLLSKADLVAIVEVESEPVLWSDVVPGNAFTQFVLVGFRPLGTFRGKVPAHGRLDVAIPTGGKRQYEFKKGGEYLLFLTSPASNHALHWRPVSPLFAVQRRDRNTEMLIRSLLSSNLTLRNPSGNSTIRMPTAPYFSQPPSVQSSPLRPSPPIGDDPGAMQEYRRRVETMPTARLPLPSLQPSRVERLMEAGGSH